MTQYFLCSRGYDCPPAFDTLDEARRELRLVVAESLAMAKRRFGQAYKHKLDSDAYEITLAPDRRSTLYASHWILAA